jgi:hypothetical protein
MERELLCVFCSQKSFGKKAYVRQIKGKLVLRSYKTDVCYIDTSVKNEPILHIKDMRSATTLRHIKEFLMQNAEHLEQTYGKRFHVKQSKKQLKEFM